jgi:acetyl esterase/lipase
VQYGTGQVAAPSSQKVPLLLDLYRPAGVKGPLPIAIVIHGGGFKAGSRDESEAFAIAEGLASKGIMVASIDYRLMGQKPVPSFRISPLLKGLPSNDFSRAAVAAVDDTLTAIYFLRHNADTFGIDAGRIGLVGGSAGAMSADHVAYVLDDYGIKQPRIRVVASLWGGVLVASPTGGNSASQLETGEAPLFAAHGDQDDVVPVQMSDDLIARAGAQAVPNEYIRIAGAGHNPQEFFNKPISGNQTGFDRMVDFTVAKLRR